MVGRVVSFEGWCRRISVWSRGTDAGAVQQARRRFATRHVPMVVLGSPTTVQVWRTGIWPWCCLLEGAGTGTGVGVGGVGVGVGVGRGCWGITRRGLVEWRERDGFLVG